MKKNNIFLILFMMLVTASCQTLKDAVSGSKQENSDEFLVQKKNPLVSKRCDKIRALQQ